MSIEPEDLTGTGWALTTLDGQPVLEDMTVTLELENGRAARPSCRQQHALGGP